MNPSVTVLISNYNYAMWIEEAIVSGINQDYDGQLNVVVVDDGSTDKSVEIAERTLGLESEYQTHEATGIAYNTRVNESGGVYMLIKIPGPTGPSNGRNVGIELSKEFTDIYAILDADDSMYPTKVSSCVEVLRQSPQIGVVYANYNILNLKTGCIITEHKEPFSLRRLRQECIVHSGSLITKQALMACADQFGYYDHTMRTCEDYDLWMRIAEKFMIVHISDVLTLVRVSDHCSSSTVPKETWQQNWVRVHQKAQLRNG